MNSIRRFAEDRGLRVTCEMQGGLRQVVADPDKLEKIFLNLLFSTASSSRLPEARCG